MLADEAAVKTGEKSSRLSLPINDHMIAKVDMLRANIVILYAYR